MPKTIGNLWIKVPEPPGGPFSLHPLSILTVRPHPRKWVNKDPELSQELGNGIQTGPPPPTATWGILFLVFLPLLSPFINFPFDSSFGKCLNSFYALRSPPRTLFSLGAGLGVPPTRGTLPGPASIPGSSCSPSRVSH